MLCFFGDLIKKTLFRTSELHTSIRNLFFTKSHYRCLATHNEPKIKA